MVIEANFTEVFYMKYARLRLWVQQSNVHNVLAAISYVSKHAFFPPFLKHVPAQGGERNTKGLLKRRSLEKIKFLQQFWSTAARGCRNSVYVGRRCARWFLGWMVWEPLRFSAAAEEERDAIYWIQSMFRQRAMNANMSETSSITLAVGFPAPWPALVSTWISRGLFCFRLRPTRCWRVAMNLREWSGTTRSSWSAVRRSMDGYWISSASGSFTLCSGEYLKGKGTSMRPGINMTAVCVHWLTTQRPVWFISSEDCGQLVPGWPLQTSWWAVTGQGYWRLGSPAIYWAPTLEDCVRNSQGCWNNPNYMHPDCLEVNILIFFKLNFSLQQSGLFVPLFIITWENILNWSVVDLQY